MLIYRIENSKGIGPYHSKIIYSIESRDMFCWERCPGPIEDTIYEANEEFYYGFKSMWQLRRWFNKQVRKEIVKHSYTTDFYYSIYKVDPSHVKIGKKQVAFIKNKAKLINRQLLSEI